MVKSGADVVLTKLHRGDGHLIFYLTQSDSRAPAWSNFFVVRSWSGSIQTVFFFFFILLGNILLSGYCQGVFELTVLKDGKCVISGNHIQCWNSTLACSCCVPRRLTAFIACCWSDHKGQTVKYKVNLHFLSKLFWLSSFFLLLFFSNWRNISAGTHTQGQR